MRVFVLCTGRCGSMTLARACAHLTNYTAGRETRAKLIGADRFAYPDQHVEVDNRLSWFLGDLDRRFGDGRVPILRRHGDRQHRGVPLRGKPRQLTVWLEDAPNWLPDVWTTIEGEGDLQAAMDEFNVHHNATT